MPVLENTCNMEGEYTIGGLDVFFPFEKRRCWLREFITEYAYGLGECRRCFVKYSKKIHVVSK